MGYVDFLREYLELKMGYVDFWRVCVMVKYWRGLHVDLQHTHTHSLTQALQEAGVPRLATPLWPFKTQEAAKACWEGRPGRQGNEGRVVGQVWGRAWWGGGQVGRLAWRGGQPGGMVVLVIQRGWIFQVKNVLE